MVVIVRAPRTYASRSVIEATRTVVGLLNTVVTTSYVGPNITGTAQGDEFPTTELVQLDGAFYKIGTFGDTETGGGRGSASIGFDASLVSNVYGGSSTVQPPSVALLACIKI